MRIIPWGSQMARIALEGRAILVPALWSVEITNAVLMAERRNESNNLKSGGLRQRDSRQLVTHDLPTLEPRIDQTSAQSFEVLGIPGNQREPMSRGRSSKERIHNT
jgi:hypothetical protein